MERLSKVLCKAVDECLEIKQEEEKEYTFVENGICVVIGGPIPKYDCSVFEKVYRCLFMNDIKKCIDEITTSPKTRNLVIIYDRLLTHKSIMKYINMLRELNINIFIHTCYFAIPYEIQQILTDIIIYSKRTINIATTIQIHSNKINSRISGIEDPYENLYN